jgi:hypothetical protein
VLVAVGEIEMLDVADKVALNVTDGVLENVPFEGV